MVKRPEEDFRRCMTGFRPGGCQPGSQLLIKGSLLARAQDVHTMEKPQSQRKASAPGIGHVHDVLHVSEHLPH
eukprot:15206450-Heterocapsa_arctica.AAC.1